MNELMQKRFSRWLTLLVSLGLAPLCIQAASVHDLIQQGNDHYAAGRFAEALAAYQQAAEAAKGEPKAPAAELLHDQAAAQFKLGNIAEARELWVRALSLKDANFEAAVRYNLGNCAYAEALKAIEGAQAKQSDQQSSPQAISADVVLEPLGKAIDQYRDALRLDSSLQNARANLELAYKLKQQIEEHSTTQPSSQSSSQKSDKKKQDKSTQPTTDQQKQQDQQDQSDQQDQQNQSSSQPESQPSRSPESQPSQPPESQPSDQPPPTSTQPDETEDQQKQPPPTSTQPADQSPQSQPAEPLAKPEDQSGQPPEGEPQRVIRMSKDEIERLLQKVRDAERARRQALRLREQAKQQPVKRDW